MAKFTIIQAAHVDIRIDGETLELDVKPGDTELDPRVGEVLVAQGIAQLSTGKTSKPSASTDPVTSEE